MKKVVRYIMFALCIISLLAGLFTTYAELKKEDNSTRGSDYENPVYYAFYLSMESHGVVDLATPREKIVSLNPASYNLATLTNSSSYSIFINVRTSNGSTRAGNAREIHYWETAPKSFAVVYRNGFGVAGAYYRPSGQTDDDSPYGAYVQGEWHP